MGFLNFVFEWPRRLRSVKGEARSFGTAALDGENPAAKETGAAQTPDIQAPDIYGVGVFWLKRWRRRRENPPMRPGANLASLVTLPLKDTAWRTQGVLYARTGRSAEAVECFEKALATAPKQNDQDVKGETAATLSALAAVYRTLNNLAMAESGFCQALIIYEQLGRQSGVALACANLGELCELQRRWDEAEAWFKKALSIDESRDYKTGMAANHGSLGGVYLYRSAVDRGYLDYAEIMFQKALKLCEMLGAPAGVAASCGNLGVIYGARGDLSRAEAMFRRSLALEEALDDVENLASDWSNLGTVHRLLGRLTQAEDMHRRALHYALRSEHAGRQAAVYSNLSDVCLAKGEAMEARACLGAARDLFRQIGSLTQAAVVEDKLRETERLAGWARPLLHDR
jgi:tetratricopeptide (TPR) repeat protein